MSAVDTLEAAKAILANPNKWARQGMAFDRKGNEVKPEAPDACRFCMVGALRRVAPTNAIFELCIRAMRTACRDQSIFTFNDSHGHKAVLKAMNRAIHAARAA